MIFNEVLNSIDSGRDGGNSGIPMGFPRFSEIVPNIQKARYNIIVGGPGSGKSAFVDTAYVFNPLDWYIKNKDETDIKLRIHYFSFEINKDRLISKQIARKLFLDHRLLLDVNYILSYGKNRISDEHYKLVCSYADYFNRLEEYLTIYGSEGNNPTGIRNKMIAYAKENGTLDESGTQLVYKEKDPNLYTLVVADHQRLIPRERGFSLKENIDKYSEYAMWIREYLKFTMVTLAQANRNLGNVDRRRLDGDDLTLSLEDIADSSTPGQDSDLCLGLINPYKYNINTYRGYDTARLKNRFRSIQIMKNRDGEADKALPLLFLGECGFFSELPKREDMTEDSYRQVMSFK